ncbi:MAG TPA: DUF2752 domain-containing protein [Nocardioidaceae bacterium]|jgi:hypothetical protein|nr:DUF2752 domain-containing protein [Nocardioidaceae bacterium]
MTTVRVPAPPRAGRWPGVKAPVLLAAAVLLASLTLHLRDPHRSGSWGFCPWLVLTGTQCPGCGGLRAVNDLTNGNFAAAASSNLLVVSAIPVAVVLWVRWLRDSWRGVTRRVSTRRTLVWCGLLVVLAVGFAVLRNLPVGSWLLA